MRLPVDTGVCSPRPTPTSRTTGLGRRGCARHADELLLAAPVGAWLLEARLGTVAGARFLRWATTGRLRVVDLTPADYGRCVELVEQYADLGLGLADASIGRGREPRAPHDRHVNERNFRVVRPAHVDAFDLVP